MCVTFEPAKLSDTILYVGECTHAEHGLIHVLGYQNQVENSVDGPNCMILHFPAARPMGPANALDCSGAKFLLEDLRDAGIPVMWELGADPDEVVFSVPVQVFDVGAYTVVMSDAPDQIPSALARVPTSRRPTLNTAIFDWYQAHFPGYSVALCCFEGKAALKSEPLLWWYEPTDRGALHAPAIDAHSGGVPDTGATVEVDHALIVGVPEFANSEPTVRGDEVMELVAPDEDGIRYRQPVPEHLLPFLPKAVFGHDFQRPMLNGDFVIRRDGLSVNNLLQRVERRPPPA